MARALSLIEMFSVLAFLSESITEYVFDWFKYKKYAALGVGVVLACALQVNILSAVLQAFGLEVPPNPVSWWTTVVLSGILFGRGANIFHDLKTKLFPTPQEELSRRLTTKCLEK
jgi:hypothetical protein